MPVKKRTLEGLILTGKCSSGRTHFTSAQMHLPGLAGPRLHMRPGCAILPLTRRRRQGARCRSGGTEPWEHTSFLGGFSALSTSTLGFSLFARQVLHTYRCRCVCSVEEGSPSLLAYFKKPVISCSTKHLCLYSILAIVSVSTYLCDCLPLKVSSMRASSMFIFTHLLILCTWRNTWHRRVDIQLLFVE